VEGNKKTNKVTRRRGESTTTRKKSVKKTGNSRQRSWEWYNIFVKGQSKKGPGQRERGNMPRPLMKTVKKRKRDTLLN